MTSSAEIAEKAAELSLDFAKRASTHDREASFPVENYRMLHQAGLLGLTIPREYGGLGADDPLFVQFLAEIAKGCPSTALSFCMHAVIMTFIAGLGTPAQKDRYFGEVLERAARFGSAASEPRASFRDTFVMESEFETVPGGYHLRGTKHFLSIGDQAQFYAVSGKKRGSTTPSDGWILAMVPQGEGTKVVGDWDSLGMRATNSQSMQFDCIVDEGQVIGVPGALPASGLFGNFLMGYIGVYLGTAEGTRDYLGEYAGATVMPPSTQPLLAEPEIQSSLARMDEMIQGAQAMLEQGLKYKEQGDKRSTLRAMLQAKHDASEAGLWISEQAIRIVGGRGLLNSLPFGQRHRDALAGVLMPPSSQRCLRVIEALDRGEDVPALNFQF